MFTVERKLDIIDTVIEHYITNGGGPGFDPVKGNCVYHTDDGNHCAIGLFDKDKRLEGECANVSSLCEVTISQIFEADLDENDFYFLTELQACHDGANTCWHNPKGKTDFYFDRNLLYTKLCSLRNDVLSGYL